MIDMNDPSLYGIWWIGVSATSNWMGAIFEREDGNEILYRMRYLKDDLPWDQTKDELNWYKGKSKPGESIEKTVAKIRLMLDVLSPLADTSPIEIIRRGKTIDEFADALNRIPGMRQTKTEVH